MSSEENKKFIQRYLEAFSGKPKPESLMHAFIAEQALIDHAMACEGAFPGYRLDPEEIIAEGDLVSVRGRIRGRHQGTFAGIPATGREVDFSIFITYRIADGKIVDHWMLTDNMALMHQLGAVPSAV